MKFKVIILISIFLINITCINGENEKISSKLDFDESKEIPNTKPQSNSSKSSPKIQGVRVTVDTGDVKKSSESGSKESVEILETKNTKRVGIHTDITFEITEDKNESNVTNSEQDDKDDTSASVPVFKGRPSTNKPKKPYEPRIQTWIPSQTVRPVIHHHQHPPPQTPQHYNPNVPIFPRTDDENIYRRIDNWSNFVPITARWTTERTLYSPQSQIGSHSGLRNYQLQPQIENKWKPCYCITDNTNNWRRFNGQQSFRRSSSTIDDKLESPFSYN